MAESSWKGKESLVRIYDVTISALNLSTRHYCGRFLDYEVGTFSKVHGYLQDYQGLAELMGLDINDIQELQHRNDGKVKYLIDVWSTKPNATIGKFIRFLEQLEKYDLLENEIFQNRILVDVEQYMKRQGELKEHMGLTQRPLQVHVVDSLADNEFRIPSVEFSNHQEYKNITVGEVRTGIPEYFDAFVCFTMADIQFVKQMAETLEKKYSLKLCIPERDIIPGSAKDTIVAFLIAHRCKKMIIALSPPYHMSPECDFMTKFGHSIAPGARSKKLIPVLTQNPCPIPDILRYITLVDYTKCELVEWFWERLARALQESSLMTIDSTVAPQQEPQRATESGVCATDVWRSEDTTEVKRPLTAVVGPYIAPVGGSGVQRETAGMTVTADASTDMDTTTTTTTTTTTKVSKKKLKKKSDKDMKPDGLRKKGDKDMKPDGQFKFF